MTNMLISDKIGEFARGEKFDNVLVIPINQRGPILSREEVISKMIAGKRVLHIGCLDHVPLISDKIKNGSWFHQILTESAETCLGLDIDTDGIDYVRKNFGVQNIAKADIFSGEGCEIFNQEDWDYAVFGEVLEHIDNPVHFLSRFRELTGGKVKSLIITVPNAFRRGNWLSTLRSREKVNSDHYYWFTPYTLCRVLCKSGWAARSIEHCEFGPAVGISDRVKRAIIRHWPMLAQDLVATADFDDVAAAPPMTPSSRAA